MWVSIINIDNNIDTDRICQNVDIYLEEHTFSLFLILEYVLVKGENTDQTVFISLAGK